MEKVQQRSEDIRAALAAEIARKEKQLRSLRETLTALDTAMQAAAAAHAASLAAAERSVAALAMTAAEQERSSVQIPIAVAPVSKPRTAAAPKPVSPPVSSPVTEKVAEAPVAVQPPPPKETPAIPAPPEPTAPAPVYTSATNPWPAPAGKYVNMKVWKAIQNLLTEARQSMTLDEIARELEKGGASLGENPVRTVSAAIGYMNDKIFHVSKSGGRTVVSVLSPSADY